MSDQDILRLVEQALDRKNPREWYWALMDYGTFLATQYENPNRKSARYRKQSKFEGSKRQLRGAIIKLFLSQPSLAFQRIVSEVGKDANIVRECVQSLEREAFLKRRGGRYVLMK